MAQPRRRSGSNPVLLQRRDACEHGRLLGEMAQGRVVDARDVVTGHDPVGVQPNASAEVPCDELVIASQKLIIGRNSGVRPTPRATAKSSDSNSRYQDSCGNRRDAGDEAMLVRPGRSRSTRTTRRWWKPPATRR